MTANYETHHTMFFIRHLFSSAVMQRLPVIHSRSKQRDQTYTQRTAWEAMHLITFYVHLKLLFHSRKSRPISWRLPLAQSTRKYSSTN